MRPRADGPGVPLVKRVTAEQIVAFERCAADLIGRPDQPTIHTDAALAGEAGLHGPPIASGMFSVAFLTEYLTGRFGPAWQRHGHLAVAFVATTRAGDTMTADARVTGTERTADGRRLQLEVWCANQEGKRATVGTAEIWLAAEEGEDP